LLLLLPKIYYNYHYNEYISTNIIISNYPNPYKEICNFKTIKNTYKCFDESVYNHYINITDYNGNRCNNKKIIEYENDKFNRYSKLPKPYQNINTLYINEIYVVYDEYEYIRQLINLEGIPIISPIKF